MRLDNSSTVECMIDMHLVVDMGRSSMDLMGTLSYSMKLGYMSNKLKVVSLR